MESTLPAAWQAGAPRGVYRKGGPCMGSTLAGGLARQHTGARRGFLATRASTAARARMRPAWTPPLSGHGVRMRPALHPPRPRRPGWQDAGQVAEQSRVPGVSGMHPPLTAPFGGDAQCRAGVCAARRGIPMPHSPEYKMTLDLSTLKHLGIGLYSNVPTVLSEAVANRVGCRCQPREHIHRR